MSTTTATNKRDLYAASPLDFIGDLVIQGAGGAAKFSTIMADFQRRDFEALSPALLAVARGEKPPIGRYWFERTKGASKDSDMAMAIVWLLHFASRPLRIVVGATDQEQADEVRLIVRQILRIDAPLNRLLAASTTIKGAEIVGDATQSTCTIQTTDSRGSHGSRPDVTLIAELSHVRDREFAETLMDNQEKISSGVAIIETNAGFLGEWQHAWHEIARTSPRWHFSALTEPAPWIDAHSLEESRQRNSTTRYNRLWRGEWVRAGGDALDLESIEAAVTLPGESWQPEAGVIYVAGLDLATKRDHAALVILGADWIHRSVKLATCVSWAPPLGESIDLIEVQSQVEQLANRFGASVLADPHQASLMVQQLRECGLHCVEYPFTGPNCNRMASSLVQAFREKGRVELYRHDRLIEDLGRLSIVEKSFGYKLEASHTPGKGHADTAFAFAIAISEALEIAMTYSPEEQYETFIQARII